MSRKIRQQTCANCDYTFLQCEHFCPNCGQENHSPNQPIRYYFHELIESVFHFDGKIYLTLKTLFRYPGKITLEFNQNKRARYTPPVRLYVFISFIYFVLLQFPSKEEMTEIISTKAGNEISDSTASHHTEINDSENLLKIDSSQSVIKDSSREEEVGIFKLILNNNENKKFKNVSFDQIDSIIIAEGMTPGYFTRKLFKQYLKTINADENYIERLREKAYKFASVGLFFLMPAFAFIIYLLHFRRSINYYEYLIFSIHYHTLVFITLSIFHLVSIFILLSSFIGLGLFVLLLWYLAKSLQLNYPSGRMNIAIKMLALGLMYSVILLIVFLMVIILGWWFV